MPPNIGAMAYCYDRVTAARALVEQRYTNGWVGEIHIQTQRGQAHVLLERLLNFVDDRHVAIGASRAREDASEPPKQADIKPAPEPCAKTKYYVSYAWGDASAEGREREAVVDRLCAEAQCGD